MAIDQPLRHFIYNRLQKRMHSPIDCVPTVGENNGNSEHNKPQQIRPQKNGSITQRPKGLQSFQKENQGRRSMDYIRRNSLSDV